MSALTLEQYGILYSFFLSTAGILWHAGKAWSNRARLTVHVTYAYEQSASRFPDGYYERYFLQLHLRNRAPKPVHIKEWGILGTSGSGPIFQDQADLPAEFPPYGELAIPIWNPELLVQRRPRIIYALDARGKRWDATSAATAEAVGLASKIIEANSKRKHGPPSWASKPHRFGSLFGPAPPSPGPPEPDPPVA